MLSLRAFASSENVGLSRDMIRSYPYSSGCPSSAVVAPISTDVPAGPLSSVTSALSGPSALLGSRLRGNDERAYGGREAA